MTGANHCPRYVVAFLLCTVLAACGGGNSFTTPPEPTITSVTVTCATTSVAPGQTDQCSATVHGTGFFLNTVTWQASAGTISNSGMFTAPMAATQVAISATSAGDRTKSGSTPVTVTAAPSPVSGVTISCPEATLAQGLVEQCIATVQGTGTFDNTVTWRVSAGSISSGLFTAPSTPGDVSITAIAAADSTKSAIAMVMVAASQKAGFEYEGVTHVSWWNDEYLSSAAASSEAALATTGANYAGVLVTQYMPARTSTTITSTSQTPSDAAVISAIQQLHSHALKVMLKPHVDVSDGSWRGDIAPNDVDAWFTSFKTFITHYAQMAQTNQVEMLCIGTEYKTMSGSANLARWTDVITAIRAVYTGKLTYAANATGAGDEFTSVSFWDQVDVIGLDGYFPLTNHNDPTIAELVAAWKENLWGLNIVTTVTNFANAHPAKPVIFTEIGYRSVAGGNRAPWDYSQAGIVDNTEQQNCYQAMYEVWTQPGSVIKGHFWWAWPAAAPGPGDTDYNPRNKPAQTVLQNWQ